MNTIPLRAPFLALAVVLAAAATPALAYKGTNYGEGDPTPMTVRAERSSADVAAEAREWTRKAPTLDYPEGQPQAIAPVKANLRAQVHADALNWMRSGLGDVQHKEAGADRAQQPYRQAMQAYVQLQQGVSAAAAVPATGMAGSVTR